ncbi:hypothetical protein TWF569_011768 [Orbilia oligospora]|nr:hypothetical protein TWF102_004441 [Orbilia oligospora]KAF3103753.1 hypothetical protein TWF706_004797 [Orbilia oligospora]KAF3110360.1 hypothetical protein TWF103_004648 [Orbilia oligospora]KAF3122513.1 hypothetical protein TWF594_002804 [Orbilia oligospora]KAF3127405.1 hypothetical protein TWF569_011768 [Orbilia oligospora]
MMPPPPSSLPYYDLGTFHRPITTKSSECQTWFDRGLIWSYGFNHQEAVKCFSSAISHDPTCPMAHWGLAHALGPNYNKPWNLFDPSDLTESLQRAYSAAKLAEEYVQLNGSRPVELALIGALRLRYQDSTRPNSFLKWNLDYADAMKSVYSRFKNDLDVATLYAEALMNLTPWQLWDLKTGLPSSKARTIEAKEALDTAIKNPLSSTHPGVLHMYIHLMEMSPQPELALDAADRLRDLIPDAGHLRHMPSHIDILVGDYRRAIASNTAAIIADEKYLTNAGLQNFYTLYRSHDYHSLIYAAMLAGKSAVALETATAMESSIPESLLRVQSPPMADWLESFLSVRAHILIRFGRWEEISNLKLPTDQSLYCVTTATMHYAKAIAAAATGRIKEAETEKGLFEESLTRVSGRRLTATNKSLNVLAVAKEMLLGELEYRKGNYKVAFEALRRAVELDDGLIYGEPWGWMVPTRHAYAALLLEQGQVERAAGLYRADLGFDKSVPRARQHPNNVWALHGYHECLRKMGREEEAGLVELQLRIARAVADVEVKASCFCRVDRCPRSVL